MCFISMYGHVPAPNLGVPKHDIPQFEMVLFEYNIAWNYIVCNTSSYEVQTC